MKLKINNSNVIIVFNFGIDMKLDVSAAYNKAPGQMFISLPLKDECVFTLSSIQEHIQEHEKVVPPRPWIMAMVDDTDKTFHFYDAEEFKKYLERSRFENPTNRQTISKVNYFAMKSIKEYVFIASCTNQLEIPEKIDLFLKASKIDPENASQAFLAQKKLVEMYFSEKKNKEAAYWLKIMVQMFPQEVFGFQHLSELCFFGKDMEKDENYAKTLLDRAIWLEPSITTYMLRAKVHHARKDYDAAIQDFDLAEKMHCSQMEVDADRSQIRVGRAMAMIAKATFKEERYKKIAGELCMAIDETQTNADAYAYLGELYRIGRGGVKLCEEEARRYFSTALEKDPQHAFAKSRLDSLKPLNIESWKQIKKQKLNNR